MSEILYDITAKLFCNKKQATAFLVDNKTAITARHAVIDHIKNNEIIELEFFKGDLRKISARVISENNEFDIAVLQLDREMNHLSNYLEISGQLIEKEDVWEIVGFPVDWNETSIGDDFCYLKGEIYQLAPHESTSYDVHLSSDYIKDEWHGNLKGLSGAPLLIDGKIKGIAVAEEYSLVKSPIKAVSIKKILKFLNECNIVNDSSYGAKTNLTNTRIYKQKLTCEELFKKVPYNVKEINDDLKFNFYHVKYKEDGTSKIDELVSYLFDVLVDYACSLEEIYQGKNDNSKMMNILKKVNEAIERIKQNKSLGSLLIWMVTEGFLSAPKAFKRISMDNGISNLNEVHIGASLKDKLTLYVGDGKFNKDLNEALNDSFEVLKNINNIQRDIFIMDNYIYDQMETSPLKELLKKFNANPEKKWEDIAIELNIFTGYDSKFLNSIENMKLSGSDIESILEAKYNDECLSKENLIYKIMDSKKYFENIKINWFTLPFNTIEDFEELFIEKLNTMG